MAVNFCGAGVCRVKTDKSDTWACFLQFRIFYETHMINGGVTVTNPSLSSSLILQHQQSTIKQKREKCEETIGLLAADGKQISTAPRVPFHLSPVPHPRRQRHCVALAFAFASHLPFTSCSPGLVVPLMFVVLPPLCISHLCHCPGHWSWHLDTGDQTSLAQQQ